MSLTELEYQQAMLAVMSHILQADGEIRDVEIENACKHYNEISGRNLNKRQLHTAIQMRRGGRSLDERLSALKDHIDLAEKVSIVKAGYHIAHSDEHLCASEMELLHEIGKSLDFTESEVDQIIAGQ